jgi:hypothetical protein
LQQATPDGLGCDAGECIEARDCILGGGEQFEEDVVGPDRAGARFQVNVGLVVVLPC